MMFDTMLRVTKGFRALNNKAQSEGAENYLRKLIRISEDNGLIRFEEEDGTTVLFYGKGNIEMVRIKVKETTKGNKLVVNANQLAKEVTRQGISAGL